MTRRRPRIAAIGLGLVLIATGFFAAEPATRRRIHERAGTIRMHGAAEHTFHFFTPEGERVWSGEGWDPRAVCSGSGHDEEGMVFRNGPSKPLWLVTRLDPAARVVEYGIVADDVLEVLHIEVAAAGDGESTAAVSYMWAPRTDAGEEQAAAHDRRFEATLGHWQDAMNAVLAGKPAHPHGGAR